MVGVFRVWLVWGGLLLDLGVVFLLVVFGFVFFGSWGFFLCLSFFYREEINLYFGKGKVCDPQKAVENTAVPVKLAKHANEFGLGDAGSSLSTSLLKLHLLT